MFKNKQPRVQQEEQQPISTLNSGAIQGSAAAASTTAATSTTVPPNPMLTTFYGLTTIVTAKTDRPLDSMQVQKLMEQHIEHMKQMLDLMPSTEDNVVRISQLLAGHLDLQKLILRNDAIILNDANLDVTVVNEWRSLNQQLSDFSKDNSPKTKAKTAAPL